MQLKWTKELPTKEGWWWIKFKYGGFSTKYVSKYNDKFIVNDPDEIVYVEEFVGAEWYGPIEPPEYP